MSGYQGRRLRSHPRSSRGKVISGTCCESSVFPRGNSRSQDWQERAERVPLAGNALPELLRGKQEAELTLSRCFSPALILQHLEQDWLLGAGQSTQANVTCPSREAPRKGLEGTSEAGHRP